MSSAAENLEEWNKQFDGIDFFPEKKTSSRGFSFEMDVAYPCRITRAKCVRSKYGDLQLEIDFDVQAGEGERDDVGVLGSSRVWLDLPKQPSDLKRDREQVIKMTQRRYDNLLRILSAAAPARFALYAEKKAVAGGNAFFDFDGEKMDNGDFNDRKAEIHSKCVEWADGLEEGADAELMQDALLYILKSPNPRSEKYPYVNYYARRPENKKVHEASGDNTVPF